LPIYQSSFGFNLTVVQCNNKNNESEETMQNLCPM